MENQVAAVADAAAAAAPGTNPYGFGALIDHGTGISYTVLAILALMSLISWYIIFTKFWDQFRLGKSARIVEKQFWAAGSPKEGAERLDKDDDFRVVAESALRAAAHHEGRLNDRISLNDWLAMALQRSCDNVNSKLSNGLSFLATVGSTAPFVGLFGTVYGILNALVQIGLSGQPSIGTSCHVPRRKPPDTARMSRSTNDRSSPSVSSTARRPRVTGVRRRRPSASPSCSSATPGNVITLATAA